MSFKIQGIKEVLQLGADILLYAKEQKCDPVLIVDDEQGIGELITSYLDQIGIESEFQTTVEGAEVALAQRKFSMVFLDISFPHGENGLHFAERIQRHKDYRHIWVVMLTGVRVWIETAKGKKLQSETDLEPLPEGKLIMWINKGQNAQSLMEAVYRAAKLVQPNPARSKRVFAVAQATAWAFFLAGYGTHAGWWQDLIKEIANYVKRLSP